LRKLGKLASLFFIRGILGPLDAEVSLLRAIPLLHFRCSWQASPGDDLSFAKTPQGHKSRPGNNVTDSPHIIHF
jgi:hypothetical protein